MKPSSAAQSDAGRTNTQTGVFPGTIWPELDRIKGAASAERQDLYNLLIQRYWKPVYCFVLYSGYGEQHTKELVADFFANCFVKNVFAEADRRKGRFRSFLLTSLKNFIANERRHDGAIKRNPPGGFLNIDDLATSEGWPVQLADTKNPEDAFDRAWWRELLLRALEALKKGYQASGMDTHYEILVARIVRPILEGSEPVPFRELANKHGLTEKEAANRLLTARRAFQRLLRAEISLYASSEEEVTSEIKDIFRFLSGS